MHALYQHSTFVVENLPTGTAVMLSSECRKWFTTMEAVIRVLITHPELPAE
jgi:hypothetical protein